MGTTTTGGRDIRQPRHVSPLHLPALISMLVQALEETDNRCKEGEECIHRDRCQSWSTKRAQLKPEERGNQFYKDLLAELRESVCNKKEKGVCCPPRQDSSQLPPIGKCGKPRESVHHIIGGTDTPLGEFPFTALLGSDDDAICSRSSTRLCWICGGTLINDRYILTVAHCVGSVTKVRLGEHTVTRI